MPYMQYLIVMTLMYEVRTCLQSECRPSNPRVTVNKILPTGADEMAGVHYLSIRCLLCITYQLEL
mgnify:CR=1 FL=1